jgi:ssDNA-binding Zn-finger/Zn-ribbon topoisomerase 1
MAIVKDTRTAKRCPDCGGTLVIKRNGGTGQHFLGCENFSSELKCKYTELLPEDEKMRAMDAPRLPGF